MLTYLERPADQEDSDDMIEEGKAYGFEPVAKRTKASEVRPGACFICQMCGELIPREPIAFICFRCLLFAWNELLLCRKLKLV